MFNEIIKRKPSDLEPRLRCLIPLNGEESDHRDVVETVRQYFPVREYYLSEGGLIEFKVEMPQETKNNFRQLVKRLRETQRTAILKATDEGGIITVGTRDIKHRFRVTIPMLLFTVVVATVAIDGWFRSLQFGARDPLNSTLLYVVGLLGIIGIHEMGHKVAAYKHGVKSSLPYFIPGIPTVTLPTFGAMIMSREPMVNRDALFDLGVSGPLAGMAVTVVVAFEGALTSKFIPTEEVTSMIAQGELLQLPTSPLMTWIFSLAARTPEGMTPILSPLGFAAWLGFFITFLNLIPAAQLDGGHIARATLGKRIHRAASYGSIALLIFLGFIPMALLLLVLMTMMPVDVRPLDDVSPLSKGRKSVFLLVIGLAILSAPIPLQF